MSTGFPYWKPIMRNRKVRGELLRRKGVDTIPGLLWSEELRVQASIAAKASSQNKNLQKNSASGPGGPPRVRGLALGAFGRLPPGPRPWDSAPSSSSRSGPAAGRRCPATLSSSPPGPLPSAGAGAVRKHLPYICRGEVVRGLGRGSKQLGIPAANFPEQVVANIPCDLSPGIYYGRASVGNGDVHKMVLSIGWNPHYKNTKKSMETHMIHTFKDDFYGEMHSIVITGYIRPEKNFSSLDAFISAIQNDIEEAKRQLDFPEHLKLKEDNFFHVPESKSHFIYMHFSLVFHYCFIIAAALYLVTIRKFS
ncbi:LOW QUALITY PROTEIN: uncharacterized protein LOC141508464 [Macrotis lagotis]|uniref:LOW QUALITY PROTEIN: uncharacterized protein LOC141508464 n=1 Tax=Macrotis lagotis TaxID=92651 RepID=UPI003D697508